MTKKVTILVATSTLVLGKRNGAAENDELPAGEELTKDIAAQFGLKKADIDDLLERGHLRMQEVRAADSGRGNDPAIVAAEARANDAEAALAAEKKRADDAEAARAALEKELAVEKKRADDAEKDADELEKHVETLEKQIEDLTTQLEEATKPADDAGKAKA